MDLIILIIAIVIVAIIYKDFRHVVLSVGIIEIFFRVLSYIGNHIGVKEISSFLNEYIPISIPHILGKYANGLLYEILMWIFIAVFCFFLYYLVKYFIKKK